MLHKKTNILLVALGFVLGAGSLVYAATTWQGTSTIQDGTIIQAQTIKDNFDYLYERSWDFLINPNGVASHITNNLPVAAPAYCDENGENCASMSDQPPVCTGDNALQWDGEEWLCTEGQDRCEAYYQTVENRRWVTKSEMVPTHEIRIGQDWKWRYGYDYFLIDAYGQAYQCVDGGWVSISSATRAQGGGGRGAEQNDNGGNPL